MIERCQNISRTTEFLSKKKTLRPVEAKLVSHLKPRLVYTQGQNAELVALIFRRLRARYPAPDDERYTDEYWEDLRAEFKVHDWISQHSFPFALFLGIFIPSMLRELLFARHNVTGTDLAFALGFGIAWSVGYLALVCLLKGWSNTLPRMTDHAVMMHAVPAIIQFKMMLWMAVPGLLLGVLGIWLF